MTKLCKDCKHSEVLNGIYFCVSPSVGVSAVHGKPNAFSCNRARSSGIFGTCKPEGIYFDPKPPKPTLLQRIANFLTRAKPRNNHDN